MHKILIKLLLILGLLSLSACSDSKNNNEKKNTKKNESKNILLKPAYDYRLDNYEYGKVWYDTSDMDYESSFNLGVLYHKRIKDFKLAEFWYLKSWNKKKDNEVAFNLAEVYEVVNDYLNVKKFYKESYYLGDKKAAFNLALIYQKDLNNLKEALIWYKKAIERESLKAIKNLSRLYHLELKDDIQAVEYFLPLIKNRYTKEKVLNYLKNKWKLSDATIKKGYEAQLKSTIIPEKLKYKGGL